MHAAARATVTACLLASSCLAADPPAPAAKPPAKPKPPAPTLANVPYGTHERQVLDFWRAPSDKPTPLVFYIHGGGWVRGDKNEVNGSVASYLAHGISVVSIHYRFTWQAQLADVKPPVSWPLHDAARALQFVRSKAVEWNINPQRIGASGTSAGACTSLWLAFHDDMADPKSPDPIARQSTRLRCAAVRAAQTSLDPEQLKQWTPNSRYAGHAFGFMDPNDLKTRDTRFDEFLQHRSECLAWIHEYSPIEHAGPGDPSVYLIYDSPPAPGQIQKDPTHTANQGLPLQHLLQQHGVPCELVHPGAPSPKHPNTTAFLIDQLTRPD